MQNQLCDNEHGGLERILQNENIDKDLIKILSGISRSVIDIGMALKKGEKGFGCNEWGSENSFGDKQLEIDITSDKFIMERLRESQVCIVASSEETTREVGLGGTKYAVAFDPLDGSSIIDANFTVGSIFGIYESNTFLNLTGRQQKAALISMYGPRITMVLAIGDIGRCIELTLIQQDWQITKSQINIQKQANTFAPGNLRSVQDNLDYNQLVMYWIQNGYTLRYSGGLVPDVYHILIKGQGVFTNVSSQKAKAKLRLLYECAPIAYIIEMCGGQSMLDSQNATYPTSVLDCIIDQLDKRVGVCFGGANDVQLFQSFIF